MSLLTKTPEETAEIGRIIGKEAQIGIFIGLSGDLGCGKTVFAGGVARGLGINSRVLSPTFQLVREYSGILPLFHFDFYRLDNTADIISLDIAECLNLGVVVAEWADKFPGFSREKFVDLSFSWLDENKRSIKISNFSPSAEQMIEKVTKKLDKFIERN